MVGRDDLRGMTDAWQAYIDLAMGFTETSRKRATKVVKQLVGKGNATSNQLQSMAEELVNTGLANREAMVRLVRFELDRTLGRVGLATAEEVSGLTKRVHELEEKLRTAEAALAAQPVPAAAASTAAVPAATPVKSAPANTAPAKKVAAKKVAAKAAPAAAAPSGSTPAKAVPAKTAAAPTKTAAPKSAPAKAAPAKAAKAAPAKSAAPAKAVPAGSAPAGAAKVTAKKTVAKKAVASRPTGGTA